jgi:putative alpha-1,2-mannosidase
VIGTPMFDKTTLKLSGNRTVILSREGQGIYVQSVTLNGKPYASLWMPIGTIQAGTNELHFTMGTTRNVHRGTAAEERPPSFR